MFSDQMGVVRMSYRIIQFILVLQALLAGNAQATDYSLTVSGGQSMYAGYDTYIQLNVLFNGSATNVYFNNIALPTGIGYELFCNYGTDPCWLDNTTKRLYIFGDTRYATETATLRFFTTEPDTAPGDYTASITTDAGGGIVHTIDVPLHVLPAPTFVPTPPAYSPPIPGMKKWKDTMLTLGTKWCDASKVYSFGYEGDVWYYDGARVYFQIADYTGDQSWEACAYNIARQYRDAIMAAPNGWGQGWRVFPHGLRMAYERSGDESYKNALMLLATKSAFAHPGGRLTDDACRETAYIVETYINAEKLGAPRNPLLARAVSYLLGDVEVLFDTHNYMVHQTFYDGLIAEALIEYYELTEDPRIPPAIQKILDWTWSTGWDNHAEQLVYNPDVVPRTYYTNLNNLLVPAFAWYYSITGDVRYQRRGDEMFAHALDSDISFSGKLFSQNYRWSFAYATWRNPTDGAVSVWLPEWIPGGSNINAEVELSTPATPPCGELVHLTSSDPQSLKLPKGVVLNDGDLSRSIVATTGEVTRDTPVSILSSYKDSCGQEPITDTTVAVVGPNRLRLVLNAALQYGGTFANNRVILDGTTPEEGYDVALSSSNPELVSFEYNGAPVTSISITPASYTTDYFVVKTGYVDTPTTVTITATAGTMTTSAPLTIYPPKFRVALVAGSSVTGGATVDLNEVVIDAPAPADGVIVNLVSSVPSLVAPPPSVTVPAGAISAPFTYTSVVTPTFTGVTITATYEDKVASTALTVDSRALSMYTLPTSLVSGQTKQAQVLLNGSAPADLTVALSASDSTLLSVPASVIIKQGSQKSEVFSVTAGPVSSTTVVGVTAQLGVLTAKGKVTINPAP